MTRFSFHTCININIDDIRILSCFAKFVLSSQSLTRLNFLLKKIFNILQYSTSAIREIANLLTGNSQLTLAAVLKLIDEDFFPQENAEWAKSVTAKAKLFLAVSIA